MDNNEREPRGNNPGNQGPPLQNFDTILQRNLVLARREVQTFAQVLETLEENIRTQNLPVGANSGVFGAEFLRNTNNFQTNLRHYSNVVGSNLIHHFPEYEGDYAPVVFGNAPAQVKAESALGADSLADSTISDNDLPQVSPSDEENVDLLPSDGENINLARPEVQGHLKQTEDEEPIQSDHEPATSDDQEPDCVLDEALPAKVDNEIIPGETASHDDTFHSAIDKTASPVRIDTPSENTDVGYDSTHIDISICPSESDCSLMNIEDNGERGRDPMSAASIAPASNAHCNPNVEVDAVDATLPDIGSLNLEGVCQADKEADGILTQIVSKNAEVEGSAPIDTNSLPETEKNEGAPPLPEYEPISDEEDPWDFLASTPGVGKSSSVSTGEIEDSDLVPVPDNNEEGSVSRVEETADSLPGSESEMDEQPNVEEKETVLPNCLVVLRRLDTEAFELRNKYRRRYNNDFQVLEADEDTVELELVIPEHQENKVTEQNTDTDVSQPGPSCPKTLKSKKEQDHMRNKPSTAEKGKEDDRDSVLDEIKAELVEALKMLGEMDDFKEMPRKDKELRKKEMEQEKEEEEENRNEDYPPRNGSGQGNHEGQNGGQDLAIVGSEDTSENAGTGKHRRRPRAVDIFLAGLSLKAPMNLEENNSTVTEEESPVPGRSQEDAQSDQEGPESSQQSVEFMQDQQDENGSSFEYNSDASDISLSSDDAESSVAGPKKRKKKQVTTKNREPGREKGSSHYDLAEIKKMEKLLTSVQGGNGSSSPNTPVAPRPPPPLPNVITICSDDDSDWDNPGRKAKRRKLTEKVLEPPLVVTLSDDDSENPPKYGDDDEIQEIKFVPKDVEVLTIQGKEKKRRLTRKSTALKVPPSPASSISTFMPSESEEEADVPNKKRRTDRIVETNEDEDGVESPPESDIMETEETDAPLPLTDNDKLAGNTEETRSTSKSPPPNDSQSLLTPGNSQEIQLTPPSSRNTSSISVSALAPMVRKGRRKIRKVKEVVTEAWKDDMIAAQDIKLESQQIEDLNRESLSLVLSVDTYPVIEVDYAIASKLKVHQRDGIRFLWTSCFRHASGSGDGGILSHCMGLGKTLQALAFLHTLLTHEVLGIKYCLVLCPLNISANWEEESNKWLMKVTKHINFYNLSATTDAVKLSRLQAYKENGGIALIHYEGLLTVLDARDRRKEGEDPDIDEAAGNQISIRAQLKSLGEEVLMNPQILVCDEGHILRNPETIIHQTITKIATKRKIILTGTPMQNNLMEYYSMIKIIKPKNILGDDNQFRNQFKTPIENGQHFDSEKEDIEKSKRCEYRLAGMTQHFIHRRYFDVLCKLLPEPKYEYAIFLNLTDLQQNLYRKYMETVESKVKGASASAYLREGLFKDFSIIQKFCCHPMLLFRSEGPVVKKKKKNDLAVGEVEDLVEENVKALDLTWTESVIPVEERDRLGTEYTVSVKMMALKEIMATTFEEKEKLLVFSRYRSTLDVIMRFIEQDAFGLGKLKLEEDYYRVDGTTPSAKRHAFCKSFNKSKRAKLFLITTKAGGLGVNLHSANRVVMVDVSMNPSDDQQSIFRIFRIGQTKPCYIYRLICRGGIEEKIYNRCLVKLAIGGRVVDQQQSTRNVSLGNTSNLYEYNPESVPVGAVDPSKPVPDPVLRKLLGKPDIVASYVEHESLLQDNIEEHLNEEQKELAKKEGEEDKQKKSAQKEGEQPAETKGKRGRKKKEKLPKGSQNPGPSSSTFQSTLDEVFASVSAGAVEKDLDFPWNHGQGGDAVTRSFGSSSVGMNPMEADLPNGDFFNVLPGESQPRDPEVNRTERQEDPYAFDDHGLSFFSPIPRVTNDYPPFNPAERFYCSLAGSTPPPPHRQFDEK